MSAGRASDTHDRIARLEAALASERAARLRAEALVERWTRAIEDAPVGIGLIGLDGQPIVLNRAMRSLGGLADGVPVDATVQQVTHPDDLPGTMVLFGELIEGRRDRYRLDKRYVRPDGTLTWGRLSASLVRDPDGTPAFVVTVVEDVTDVRRLEGEALRAQRLDALGVMAGGLAHDFGNLLMGILGNVTLARTMCDEGPATDRLEEARTGILRARDLTQRLLAFAKDGSPARRPLDLAALARQTATLALRGTGTVLHVHAEPDLWTVLGDDSRLGQVVSNLVVNASQAMDGAGEVEVRLSNVVLPRGDAGPLLPPGPYVRLAVRDHGAGIPDDLLPRIFDPYFTTKPGGTGLGLATCHAVVRNQGGHVGVVTEVGKGTEFEVFLPAMKG